MYEYVKITNRLRWRLDNLDTMITMDRNGLGYPSLNETAFFYKEDDGKLSVDKKDYITKRDIMIIFDVADKKALAILKLMQQVGMAVQIGKEYYTSRKKLDQFLEEQMGNTIVL